MLCCMSYESHNKTHRRGTQVSTDSRGLEQLRHRRWLKGTLENIQKCRLSDPRKRMTKLPRGASHADSTGLQVLTAHSSTPPPPEQTLTFGPRGAEERQAQRQEDA